MRVWIVIIFHLFLFQELFSQRLNRLNKHGERKGRWIVYSDSTKKIKTMDARFRKGNAVGKAYYYNSEGILGRKEIIRFKKLKLFFITPTALFGQPVWRKLMFYRTLFIIIFMANGSIMMKKENWSNIVISARGEISNGVY